MHEKTKLKKTTKRQREGIAKAKAEGKFKRRKPLDQKIAEEVLRRARPESRGRKWRRA